ncbi:hypothetical protein T01_4386 [Trichinella spiralis]|uniref:Uncharacterized protein n=1 Tax=Trichinella spiralis TaxID=6334 RepID=A0A0V1B458_TRISP|nr:hypothetical protein T01_4386 [Trichinella spiralis]
MNAFDCGRYALEHGGQAIVRPNLDWCTERVEKESHSVINVKSTVAIFKQWSNISRLTAFGMTTIIPPFWSMENCSRTCQNGRIAAGRLPRPGLVFSIVASVFLLFDLSMERESATFAMTDKSPSASSSAVVASSIVDLLGAFASVFSFQGIHFAVNAYSGILKCKRSRRTLSCLSSTNSNERSPSMNCRYFRIVIQSAPCATDSVRPSGLGRSVDHGEEKHSRVMLFGVKSDKTPNLGQMLIFIVLLEHLSGAVLSITRLCYSSEGFQRAEQRPQTIDRCWCRVRNGQNPTAMIMQPPNRTVDSADLVLAAFRAMLLFAARAHAVRAHFICSSRSICLPPLFVHSSCRRKRFPFLRGSRFPGNIITIKRQVRKTVFISKSEQGPSPIRHSRFHHQQQHTLQLTYYRNTPLIFKYLSAYGSIILLPLRCLDKYSC